MCQHFLVTRAFSFQCYFNFQRTTLHQLSCGLRVERWRNSIEVQPLTWSSNESLITYSRFQSIKQNLNSAPKLAAGAALVDRCVVPLPSCYLTGTTSSVSGHGIQMMSVREWISSIDGAAFNQKKGPKCFPICPFSAGRSKECLQLFCFRSSF